MISSRRPPTFIPAMPSFHPVITCPPSWNWNGLAAAPRRVEDLLGRVGHPHVLDGQLVTRLGLGARAHDEVLHLQLGRRRARRHGDGRLGAPRAGGRRVGDRPDARRARSRSWGWPRPTWWWSSSTRSSRRRRAPDRRRPRPRGSRCGGGSCERFLSRRRDECGGAPSREGTVAARRAEGRAAPSHPAGAVVMLLDRLCPLAPLPEDPPRSPAGSGRRTRLGRGGGGSRTIHRPFRRTSSARAEPRPQAEASPSSAVCTVVPTPPGTPARGRSEVGGASGTGGGPLLRPCPLGPDGHSRSGRPVRRAAAATSSCSALTRPAADLDPDELAVDHDRSIDRAAGHRSAMVIRTPSDPVVGPQDRRGASGTPDRVAQDVDHVARAALLHDHRATARRRGPRRRAARRPRGPAARRWRRRGWPRARPPAGRRRRPVAAGRAARPGPDHHLGAVGQLLELAGAGPEALGRDPHGRHGPEARRQGGQQGGPGGGGQLDRQVPPPGRDPLAAAPPRPAPGWAAGRGRPAPCRSRWPPALARTSSTPRTSRAAAVPTTSMMVSWPPTSWKWTWSTGRRWRPASTSASAAKVASARRGHPLGQAGLLDQAHDVGVGADHHVVLDGDHGPGGGDPAPQHRLDVEAPPAERAAARAAPAPRRGRHRRRAGCRGPCPRRSRRSSGTRPRVRPDRRSAGGRRLTGASGRRRRPPRTRCRCRPR